MADVPELFITYKRADGGLVWGEYTFVTEPDGLDEDLDEPDEYIKETWQLVSRETVVFKPYGWDELQAELAAEAAEEQAECNGNCFDAIFDYDCPKHGGA